MVAVLITLFVALPLMSIATAEDAYGEESGNSNSTFRERIRRFAMKRLAQQKRPWIALWLFKGAEAVTVKGTVTAHYRKILILTTSEGDRLNIVLPRVWSIGSEIVQLNQIFEEGYLSIGDEIVIEALNRTVTNENGVTVTILFGYELIDENNGNHLYAVLPFNINEQ